MTPTPLIFLTADVLLAKRWQAALPQGKALTDVRQLAELSDAHIVLLDLDGLTAPVWQSPDWPQLRDQHRWVACSGVPDEETGLQALQQGCVGYCHAFADPGMLQQVVQVVSAGELWVGRALLTRLLAAVQQRVTPVEVDPLAGRLSEREAQVARLAAQGVSNKQIARDLDITERTVKAHLTSSFAKLGVSDRLQLSLLLNRRG